MLSFTIKDNLALQCHFSAQDSWETSPGHLRCEFCGKLDIPRKFKRSKRFCSMACAKRYNVGCTKRLGLFSPKEEKPERVKHKMKVQGPKAKALKGARGKFGRLEFNVTQPWVGNFFVWIARMHTPFVLQVSKNEWTQRQKAHCSLGEKKAEH